jgi:hypothetical protein
MAAAASLAAAFPFFWAFGNMKAENLIKNI